MDSPTERRLLLLLIIFLNVGCSRGFQCFVGIDQEYEVSSEFIETFEKNLVLTTFAQSRLALEESKHRQLKSSLSIDFRAQFRLTSLVLYGHNYFPFESWNQSQINGLCLGIDNVKKISVFSFNHETTERSIGLSLGLEGAI